MADLMDLMQGQLSKQLLGQLAGQLGDADEEKTKTAAEGVFSTLLSGLSKNAAKPEGANSLLNALDRDHDGSFLDDIAGFATGKKEVVNPRTTNGDGILKHVLGDKIGGAVDLVSNLSGLEKNQTGSLFSALAPMVMGVLGKQKKQQGLDAGMLANMLSGSVKSASSKRNEMSMVEKLLDQDGDGSVVDDLLDIGMKFFRKK